MAEELWSAYRRKRSSLGGLKSHMKNKLDFLVTRIRLLVADTEAQDMVEYALLAGFVAVAAGALLPGISSSISTIFSKMGSVLTAASGS